MTWEKYEYEFMKRLLKPWVVGIHKPPVWERKDRDIKVDYADWTSKTYEIKSCPKAKEYWSIPVEYEYDWKPSGVFASKADYVVYYIDNQFYMQDRWVFLAELVWVNKYSTVWGDNDKSKMFIVNLETAKTCLFHNK